VFVSAILSTVNSFILAVAVSAVIFLAIPVSNFLGLKNVGGAEIKARPIQSVAKMPAKKKRQPPKKRKAPQKKAAKSKAPRQIARQNFAMDLSPGGGAGGASVAMDAGGMGAMTYEEGETDTDMVFVSGRNPEYPKQAAKHNIHGLVEAILTVSEQGGVMDIQFLQTPGDYGFEESVRTALQSWKFKPAMLDGMPVRQKMQQSFEF
jgi:protein TonB